MKKNDRTWIWWTVGGTAIAAVVIILVYALYRHGKTIAMYGPAGRPPMVEAYTGLFGQKRVMSQTSPAYQEFLKRLQS